jgi:hypothetical protein
MDADDETFDAKMKVLKEDVEHHVEEEQDELFPKASKALGKDRLEELGRQLEARKQSLASEQGGSRTRLSLGVRRVPVPRSSAGSSGRARGYSSGSDDDLGDDSGSQEMGSSAGSREGSSLANRGSSSDTRDDAMGGGSKSGSMDTPSRSESMGGPPRSRSKLSSDAGSARRPGGRSHGGSRGRSRERSAASSRSQSSASGSRSRSGGSRGRARSRSRR